MKTKLFGTAAIVVVAVSSMFASQTTVTGIITDNMCTKKHMMPGKTNADCVRECIKHAAKYVLVSKGKVLPLSGNQQKLNELAGKKAKLTGELKGGTLAVVSAEAAQ